MTDDELAPQPGGQSTTQLMLIVALFGLLFGFVVMAIPSAFHQDSESWRIYKAITLGTIAFVIIVCARRPHRPHSEWSTDRAKPGDDYS